MNNQDDLTQEIFKELARMKIELAAIKDIICKRVHNSDTSLKHLNKILTTNKNLTEKSREELLAEFDNYSIWNS